jgi:hypothetical protein
MRFRGDSNCRVVVADVIGRDQGGGDEEVRRKPP